MDFYLELLEDNDKALEQLQRRAQKLASGVDKKKEKLSVSDAQKGIIEDLVQAINNTKSWQILQHLDGCYLKSPLDVQIMAGKYLSEEQFQEAFTIAINAALLFENNGPPGYNKGHSILYEAIANRPESRFYETITPELRGRLINGRFWENLSDLNPSVNCGSAYSRIEDILMNHYSDLKTSFAPRGLYIFSRNSGFVKNFYLYNRECFFLSVRAIDRFVDFARRIDSELYGLNISSKDFAPVVLPYINLVLKDHEVYDLGIFRDINKRVKDPLVGKYSQFLPQVFSLPSIK